jgi:phospholipid/cholesterol/gamma-HCH transport system ATP-binding protein
LVDDLGITVFLATHDLDTLLTVVDRVIVLARGTVLADGTVQEVMAVDDEWIKSYFSVRTMVTANDGRPALVES